MALNKPKIGELEENPEQHVRIFQFRMWLMKSIHRKEYQRRLNKVKLDR
jgi:hypothetical protein